MNILEKFTPTGHMMLVKPITVQHHLTETNLAIVNNTVSKAEIVEVPIIEPYASLYKSGDTVIISQNAGHSQIYKGNTCLWVNSKGYPEGDIWAVVTDEKSENK